MWRWAMKQRLAAPNGISSQDLERLLQRSVSSRLLSSDRAAHLTFVLQTIQCWAHTPWSCTAVQDEKRDSPRTRDSRNEGFRARPSLPSLSKPLRHLRRCWTVSYGGKGSDQHRLCNTQRSTA